MNEDYQEKSVACETELAKQTFSSTVIHRYVPLLSYQLDWTGNLFCYQFCVFSLSFFLFVQQHYYYLVHE